jgi:hypothetical protein
MKRLLLLFSAILFSIAALAQIQIDDRAGYGIRDRGYAGIGLGNLSFGSSAAGNYYIIGLSPQAGYMINQFFAAGAAFDYQYVAYPQIKQHSTLYGGYPYLRFNIKKFFVQTDYDWYSAPVSGSNDRKIFNRAMIGGGYFNQGNGRGGVNFLVSYDMMWSANSPWRTPLSIRVFFTF